MSGTLLMVLVACGSDGGGSLDVTSDGGLSGSPDAGTGATADGVTIGGTISGYAGAALVLETNGEALPVPKGASSFVFPTKRPSGTAYDVAVKAQPTDPSQTCTVASGRGQLGASDVRDIAVSCTTNTYPVEITVAGLKGTLVLTNNGGDALTVDPPDGGSAKGTFAMKVASGAPYDVAVATQPANQTCTVTSGKGTIVAGPATVAVNCVTHQFAVGGTVSGLDGAGLVLQNNAGDDLAVNANGGFAFATPVEVGAPYAVSVKTNPTSKWQTCAVTNGTGTMGGQAVTTVDVACTTSTYKVGGTVAGLAGGTQVELGNGADTVVVTANAAFEFPTRVASGDTYDVKVLTQPTNPWQTCIVANNADTMKGADVSLTVTCTPTPFMVGGNVVGLPAGESVVLQNNGGDDLMVNANGAFSFVAGVASGSPYAVTVKTQPASKSCAVVNGGGTVAGVDVTTVQVICGLVGSFAVNEGPAWGSNPPTYSCVEACALKFGGVAAGYACSTSAASITNTAWVSGWGDGSHCVNGTPVAEDYKKSVNYNCGSSKCAYSAWVTDHCGAGSVNYCFAK